MYVAGLERVLLPMGFWSTNSTCFTCCQSPPKAEYSPGGSATSLRCLFRAGYRIPLISDDLPEPLTPVTTVSTFSGIFTSIPRRLFILAPFTSMARFHWRRDEGVAMRSVPFRNLTVWLRVSLPFIFSTSSRLPSKTISPPSLPASGPTSMMWSAARIISSSCSTTITVL